MPELVPERSFKEWVANSPAGAKIAYYEGLLFVDRHNHAVRCIRNGVDITPLSETADIAYDLAVLGIIHLFQTKIANGSQYIAMKASATWKNEMHKIFWKRSRFGVKPAA